MVKLNMDRWPNHSTWVAKSEHAIGVLESIWLALFFFRRALFARYTCHGVSSMGDDIWGCHDYFKLCPWSLQQPVDSGAADAGGAFGEQ